MHRFSSGYSCRPSNSDMSRLLESSEHILCSTVRRPQMVSSVNVIVVLRWGFGSVLGDVVVIV